MQSDTQTKHVTNRQGVRLAQLAREFGVLREDLATFLKDEKRREKFFNDLNTDTWFMNLQAEAKKIGARLHLIPRLVVDYTRGHKEAAMAGELQQTKSNSNDVLKVADKYHPSEKKITIQTIVLLNYPKGSGNYEKTVDWGLTNGLRKTIPHVPFAIGEQLPKLNYILGQNDMYLVETTGHTFEFEDVRKRACCVTWVNERLSSDVDEYEVFGADIDWYAFLK